MPSLMDSAAQLKSLVVKEVPAGSTAVLDCHSNDFDHNFMFWLFDQNKVVGPGNEYDERKYKYEVLSGKLHIDNVSPQEAGFYQCVSKKLDGSKLAVGEVEMLVKGAAFTPIDAVKVIAIIVSIVVIIGSAVLYMRLRKEWRRYDGRAVVQVDDQEEDDGDADEIYNPTTTTRQPTPVAGPSRNVSSDHLIYGIDNQGLDTDFNSVFENIQIKTPERSLI